jgi:hypothetical protein
MAKAGEPVVVYRAGNAQQANLLRNLLEDQGISAWVQNDMIQSAAGDLPLGWRGDCQVVVRDSDADEARNLALEFEERLRNEPQTAVAEEGDIYAATDTWDNWPKCPDCGETRHTRCPLCGQAGTRFPLVDLEQSKRGELVLLMCEACDEPFRPQFYRLCHRCGHNFGQGLELIEQGTASAREPGDGAAGKMWLVVGGMLLLGLGLAAYFVLLLRS